MNDFTTADMKFYEVGKREFMEHVSYIDGYLDVMFCYDPETGRFEATILMQEKLKKLFKQYNIDLEGK